MFKSLITHKKKNDEEDFSECFVNVFAGINGDNRPTDKPLFNW